MAVIIVQSKSSVLSLSRRSTLLRTMFETFSEKLSWCFRALCFAQLQFLVQVRIKRWNFKKFMSALVHDFRNYVSVVGSRTVYETEVSADEKQNSALPDIVLINYLSVNLAHTVS